MKVTKRILALVMTMLMVLGTCAVAASAAGDLQSAIDAASGTVTMTGDTIESVVIDKDLTLDLGGYELRGVPGSPAITVNGANVTITNGRVVSQFADVKSLTMMEKVVDESPAAILVNGGSVTVEGIRAIGGLTRVPTTSNRYLPTGNAIALMSGANATVTQSSLVGRYGVNNKVTNNPAGGTVTINDAIMLGFMRAVKDSSKEILGDDTEKENVADHIEGFLSKGIKLEERERNMMKRIFAERAIVYTKSVQDNPTFTYNECTDSYIVTANADENNLWDNNTSTDCSYKYVPEYVVLADGALIEMTEGEDGFTAEVAADQIDGIQVKYRTWFDMQPDVKEMADNFYPYLEALYQDAINAVNELYDFSLEKYTMYTELVGEIVNKLDNMGNEFIGGRAIRDMNDFKELRRAIYDLGGKTIWEVTHEGYTFGDNQMKAIYGPDATMPADGIVGTIDRVAKLKGELETFMPFEDQSKWADLGYWVYENYEEVLDIVDEAVERLAVLEEILDRDLVQQIVESAHLQDKREKFDKVQKITNDANAVLDRFMASNTVKYFIQKADTHQNELKPYINKFISIYNNHDRYFVPENFMDGNFAKGYAVYADPEMDDETITHEYGEPEWEWADDYSEATATFVCGNCGHEETVTDEQPAMTEVTAADCENDQVVTYTATVEFNEETYTDTTDEVAGPDEAIGHDWGDPEWEWADDYSEATATFICNNDETHTQTVVADIDTTILSDADCENDNVVIYTATVNFEGEEYTDTTDEIVVEESTGHAYGEPEWEWADDYSEATATFVCENCGHEETVTDEQPAMTEVTALDCVNDHVVTYTATVEFEDETYTDTTDEITLEEADGHEYGEPVWEWADDYSSVTVTFTCEKGDDTQSFVIENIDCEELEEPECGKDQVVQYLASFEFNGETYETTSDPVTLEDTALEHVWGEPDWEWADDYSSATATFTCENCDETTSLTDNEPAMTEVEPANCTDPQQVTYTATVELDGETYTDTTDVVDGPEGATGHSYGDPDWEWADDYSSATATFSCENCEHQETVTDNEPAMTEVEPANCTDPQQVTYTATVEFEDETYTDTTDVVEGPEGATDHNWSDWAADDGADTHSRFCQNDCGATETEPHDWSDWTVTTPATTEAEGEETHTCPICGKEESRPIEKIIPDELTLTPTTADGEPIGETGSEISVTVPYARRGEIAVVLTPNKEGVTFTSSKPNLLTVDEDGNVRFVRLCVFCRTATITATDADGNEATCVVKLKLKWWQILIFLLFGWLWY